MENRLKENRTTATILIILYEFCDGFAYCGVRVILAFFLTTVLMYDENTTTVIFHIFNMACFATPLLSAFLADMLFGKFRTIIYVSIIYAAGNIVLSISSIPNFLPMYTTAMFGLVITSIGTGGIRPCLPAFGGDQFGSNQEKHLRRFFSMYVLSANIGCTSAALITPILRADVKCFGEQTCFPLAFGAIGVLLIAGLILFALGYPTYKINPPSGNIIPDVTKCITYALVQKCKSREKGESKEHWLDYADDKYNTKLISDVKVLLPVLFLYIPIPVFWALYYQQGSRWALQASRMDGAFIGFQIKPDQMMVVNSILVAAFIPIFEYVIYPLLGKCHLITRPLQRIAVGGLFVALSFICAAFIQTSLEETLPVHPAEGYSQLSIINTFQCRINVQPSVLFTEILPKTKITTDEVKTGFIYNLEFIPVDCEIGIMPAIYGYQTNSSSVETIVITNYENSLHLIKIKDSIEKPLKGNSKVRIVYNLGNNETGNITFRIQNEITYDFDAVGRNVGSTSYKSLTPGKYQLSVISNNTKEEGLDNTELQFKSGGSYICVVFRDGEGKLMLSQHVMVEPNSLSMLLQAPQYFLISAGEIMFSITGIEFSYSQAPKSMKSVVQAAWFLSTAFGNLIVAIITQLNLFEKQSYEFFMFACLMAVTVLVFSIMAYYYKYVEDEADSNGLISEEIKTKHDRGIANKRFEKNTKL